MRAPNRGLRYLSPPTPGDILYSYWSLPNIDWIYFRDHDGRKRFSIDGLSSCLAFLETVVLHERIVAGSADTGSPLEKGDSKSEAYDYLNTVWRIKWVNQVQLSEEQVFKRLERDGILHFAKVQLPDLTASRLVGYYRATRSVIERRQSHEQSMRAYEKDRDRLRRIVLDTISREVGVPLLLTEFASRASIPLRVSLREADRLSQIMNIDRRIQSGVVEYLKKKLDTGALREIERLEELGHATIFPRTAIAGQILSESEKPEDMLDVTLSLRRQYTELRRQMGKLEKEIFNPELTLEKKQNMVRELDNVANELWPATTRQFQQVTSEISAVSNLAVASMSPLNFKDIPSSVLSIVDQPWELIRRYLRRRKVRAMLQTKRVFLNSRPTIELISKKFRCPISVIRQTSLREMADKKAIQNNKALQKIL